MPRRPFARALTTTSATPHASSPALPTSTPFSNHVLRLRRQWKWAAFSQFFCTFAALFNMSDVTIAVSVHYIPLLQPYTLLQSCSRVCGVGSQNIHIDTFLDVQDIEDDLTRSTSLVLPRIMQRLLYTLTQDRKVK
jgi:hypothetical protein